MKPGIKVFGPASVANVACGYDILGFALENPGDEVIVRFSDDPGFKITKITGDKGKLPYAPEKNTAGKAAIELLKHLGKTDVGIEMEIHKKMAFGTGLGSSAASAAAAVVAINDILGKPLEKRELLPFAVIGEQVADGAYHADNVAPSLIGGMVFIRSNETLDVHRIPVPHGLHAAVVYPHVNVFTREAREILNEHVTLKQHIAQNGNLGGLLVGLFKSDLDLIKRSLEDLIIEPQRAQLIPHFYQVKEAAIEAGALGSSISGAGPSIFALCANSLIAENAAKAMHTVFLKAGIECDVIIFAI